MRAFLLATVVLAATGCAGSSQDAVRYDLVKATNCISTAQPAEAGAGRLEQAASPDAFYRNFGDDRIGTMQFILVVGYGSDRPTALRRERQARSDLKEQYRGLHRAWARSDGNVVYEALGPTSVGVPFHTRPPGKTAEDALRAANGAGARMRAELARCLERSRRG